MVTKGILGVVQCEVKSAYDARKEFRSETWSVNRVPVKRNQYRIVPVRRHLVLNYLRTYWPKALWRLYESSPGDWTFEGTKNMMDIVHGFVKGVLAADEALSNEGSVIEFNRK